MHIAHVRTYDIMYEYFPRTDKSFFRQATVNSENPTRACFSKVMYTYLVSQSNHQLVTSRASYNHCPESLKIFSFFSSY